MSSEPAFSEVLALLPRSLQIRFQSLGAYVDQALDEKAPREEQIPKLSPEEIATIKLVVVARRLESFLVSTSRAGESAVETFSSLGMTGFTVGSRRFAADSPDLRLGYELAEGLREVLGENLMRLEGRPRSLAREVRQLAREVLRGRPLG